MSNVEYQAAYAFCHKSIQDDLGFTDVGMIGACLQPPGCAMCCNKPSEATGNTFCSKIVTEALQYAALPEVSHLHPCTTTPSLLLDAIRSSQRGVCDTSEFRRNNAFDSGIVFVNRMP